MDGNDLKNIYSFVYLGVKIAGDGDHMVMVKHRCDIAWGVFSEYGKKLTSTKRLSDLKVRLHGVSCCFHNDLWFKCMVSIR